MRPTNAQRGISLIELLIAIAIIGLFAAIAVPQFLTFQRRAAVRAASGELRSIFHLVRMRAITRGSNAGVKFMKSEGAWRYAIYDDGDRDGVRNDDILSGVDPCVAPPRLVIPHTVKAAIGLPPHTMKDPDGAKLPPTKSPVHFNQSTICSFSPLGSATPGTVYLTDRIGDVYAVRVTAPTARIRTMRWDPAAQKWRNL